MPAILFFFTFAPTTFCSQLCSSTSWYMLSYLLLRNVCHLLIFLSLCCAKLAKISLKLSLTTLKWLVIVVISTDVIVIVSYKQKGEENVCFPFSLCLSHICHFFILVRFQSQGNPGLYGSVKACCTSAWFVPRGLLIAVLVSFHSSIACKNLLILIQWLKHVVTPIHSEQHSFIPHIWVIYLLVFLF